MSNMRESVSARIPAVVSHAYGDDPGAHRRGQPDVTSLRRVLGGVVHNHRSQGHGLQRSPSRRRTGRAQTRSKLCAQHICYVAGMSRVARCRLSSFVSVLLCWTAASCASAATNALIVDTEPSRDATLGRNESLYVRIQYDSDEPVSLWARPYLHGQSPCEARSRSTTAEVSPDGGRPRLSPAYRRGGARLLLILQCLSALSIRSARCKSLSLGGQRGLTKSGCC